MDKKGGVGVLELLFILSMFVPTVLMGLFKIWPLFWVFVIFDIIFGCVEIFYCKATDMTVSQHFWEWSKKNKGKAIAVLVSMSVMWAALIWHLGYKMLQ